MGIKQFDYLVRRRLRAHTLACLTLCFVGLLSKGTAKPVYQPSETQGKFSTELTDFTYRSKATDRVVPLKFYLPVEKNAPLVLLSHGLGGSREVGAYLANHWASRGFIVVAMQHAGSDSLVWKDAPKNQRFKELKKAASYDSFMSRTTDVKATLDQLEQWNQKEGHVLHGRIDFSKAAIAGHSFGAVTSQAASGQKFPLFGDKFTDSRIKSALLLSPSAAKGIEDSKAFGHIQMPWMCMTGTKDTSIITPGVTVETRKKVYANLPASGNKYQLILHDASHMAFSDRTVIGRQHRNKNHHQAIIAISTAFFEAYLEQSPAAKTWLDSETGPRSILEEQDVWQRK